MKKTLALILAIVMCFSLFAIGASAVNEDFTDKDEITNDTAVNLLVGLGVINGMGDGTFDPAGTITRAQMCQIVAKICNGGKLPNISSAQQHFTDVPATHWGFQAVEYCVGKGIVSGMGDGTFAPDAPLTGSQCAKILLVAMGYNEKIHQLVGSSWEVYTAIYANANDFYDDIGDVDVSKPICREDVCQMAFNMLNAPVVKVAQSIDSDGKITSTYSQTTAAGTDNDDVIEVYFGVSVKYGYITKVDYNTAKKEFTYSVTNEAKFGGDAIDADDDGITAARLTSAVDYSALVGQKVCFIYDTKDTSKVFSIYADEDSSVLVAATLADLTDKDGNGLTKNVTTAGSENGGIPSSEIGASDTKIKVKGETYNLTETAAKTVVACSAGYMTTADTGNNPFFDLAELAARTAAQIGGTYTNEGANSDSTNRYARPWWNFRLIDNTGDGKADCVYLAPVDIAKVTYVGTTSVSLTRVDGNRCDWSAGSVDLDASGWDFNKDLAKDDYAVVKKDSKGTKSVTPMEVVKGKVDGEKPFSGRIDGTFYNSTPVDGTTVNYLKLSSTCELQVYNSYVFDADTNAAASTDLLVVKKVSGSASDVDGVRANILLLDGTTKTVGISKLEDNPIASPDNYPKIDTLYTYSVDKDGDYEIEVVGNNNLAGYDAYAKNVGNFTEKTSSAAAKIGNYTISDSAVIVIKYDDADVKYAVVSGADMKTYANLTLKNTSQLLLDKNSGIYSVQVAFIETAQSNIGTDYIYAYVTSTPYTTKVDGTTYAYYEAWTKDGAIADGVYDTVYASNKLPVKGGCVALTLNTDGTYTNQEKTFVEVAIAGYSASDELITLIKADGDYLAGGGKTVNNMKLPDKTTILNVDSANKKGVQGDSLSVANEGTVDGTYCLNAMAFYDGASLCVVFDVSNNWNNTSTFTANNPH